MSGGAAGDAGGGGVVGEGDAVLSCAGGGIETLMRE